ncbi:Sm domain-containing protein [Mycena kentingensis (nom. inval.)]|nr:Sm domain-containing protein [Mycena kentingensis (nom. inval.)]
MSSTATEAPAPSEAVARLQSLLTSTLRITVSDGRVFIGSFAGTDQPLNILLLNADEYRIGAAAEENPDGRYVGQVLIPWKIVVKAEVHAGGRADRGRAVLDDYI